MRLDFRPIAFLDEMSSTEYSSRALNAAVCVAEESPDNWFAMHNKLMEGQPAEGGSGLSDDDLVGLATASGADADTVGKCIDDRPHEDWIDYTSHRVTKSDDFGGTPTIMVNGTVVEGTAEAIDSAVKDALAT